LPLGCAAVWRSLKKSVKSWRADAGSLCMPALLFMWVKCCHLYPQIFISELRKPDWREAHAITFPVTKTPQSGINNRRTVKDVARKPGQQSLGHSG